MTQKTNVSEDSEYTGENLSFSSPGNLVDRRERSPYTLTWKMFSSGRPRSGFCFPVRLSCLSPSCLLEQSASTWACDTTRDGFSQVPDEGSNRQQIWQGSVSSFTDGVFQLCACTLKKSPPWASCRAPNHS